MWGKMWEEEDGGRQRGKIHLCTRVASSRSVQCTYLKMKVKGEDGGEGEE